MLSPPQSTSSSIIANNDDILTQILICLPDKSLRRFRCVSKQWCSLISGNYFIQKRRSCKYRHRSINGLFLHTRLDLFIRDNTWKFDFISVDPNVRGNVMSSTTITFTNDIGGIQIEQSCNGLLLCSTFLLYNFGSRRFGKNARNYYIYNPTTQQYTILPQFVDRKHSYGPYFSVSLAFNPIKSPHYKVICMMKNAIDNYDIRIYSSETCSWKVVKRSCSLPKISGSGVFWNGFLSWHNVDNSLVYFNVDREIFGEELMPGCSLLKSSKTSLYFGECNGHLYYVELSEHRAYLDPTIVIYERNYSTGWHTVCSIEIRRLKVLCLKKIGYSFLKNDVKVLLVDGEETEEDNDSLKLVLLIRDKVVSFDLGDLESIDEIHNTEPKLVVVQGFSHRKIVHAYQYIKSFASV